MATVYFSNTNSTGTGSLYDTITSANAGDTVMPSSDFTDFEINIETSLDIEKNITLDAGRHRIVITPTDSYGADISEVATVVFTNFTFNGGQTGVFIGQEDSNVTFNQCKFYGHTSRAIDYIEDVATTTFNNCIFIYNTTVSLKGICNFCTFISNTTETLTDATLNNCLVDDDSPYYHGRSAYLEYSANQYDNVKLSGLIPDSCAYDYDGNKRFSDGVRGALEMLDRSVSGTTKLFYQKATYACKNAYIGSEPANYAYFVASNYNGAYYFKWDLTDLFEDTEEAENYRCRVDLYDPTTNVSFGDGKDLEQYWSNSGSDLAVSNVSGSFTQARSGVTFEADETYYTRIGYYPTNDATNVTYIYIGFTYSGSLPSGYDEISPAQLFENASYWSTDRFGDNYISAFPTSGSVEYYVLNDVRFVDSLSHLVSDSETLHVGGYNTVVFGQDNLSSRFQSRRCGLELNKYSYLGNSTQSSISCECSNLTMGDDSKYYGKITRSNSVTHADSCSTSAWIEEGEIEGCYKIPQNVQFGTLVIKRSSTSNYDSEGNIDVYADELAFDDVGDDTTLKIDCEGNIRYHCRVCENVANENGSWFSNAPIIYPTEVADLTIDDESGFIVDLSDATEEVDLTLSGQTIQNNSHGADLTGSACVSDEETSLDLWTLEDDAQITFEDCDVTGTSYTIPESTVYTLIDGSLDVEGTLTVDGKLILEEGQENRVATLSGSGVVQFNSIDTILTVTTTCNLVAANFLIETNARGYLGVPVGTNKTAIAITDLIVGDYGAKIQSFTSRNGSGTVTQYNPVDNATFLVETVSGSDRSVVLSNVATTSFDLTSCLSSSTTTLRTFDGANFVVTTDFLRTIQTFHTVVSQASSSDSNGVLTAIYCPHSAFPKVGQTFVLMASVYKNSQRTSPLLPTMTEAPPEIVYSIYKRVKRSSGYEKEPVTNFVNVKSYTALLDKYTVDKHWRANEEGYNVLVIPQSSPFAEPGKYEIDVVITLNDDSTISFSKQIIVLN